MLYTRDLADYSDSSDDDNLNFYVNKDVETRVNFQR